jgi:hypothetical protein
MSSENPLAANNSDIEAKDPAVPAVEYFPLSSCSIRE